MTITKPRSIVFSLALMTLTVMHARAQDEPTQTITQDFKLEVHYGLKGGANVYQLNGSGFANGVIPGFDAGGFAEINFTPQIGVQPELLFNMTGYKTGKYFSGSYTDGVNNLTGHLYYISVPILFTYTPVKWLGLQIGPQLGFLLNDDRKPLSNTQTVFRNGDFSWVMGTQLNFHRAKIGLRYVVGVTNLNGLSTKTTFELASWSNSGAQLYLGYRIF